tara:strand:+ start:7040 stop:7996 length:957 start_codon:yes stop_codon:yes gene_type:complete
MKIDPKEIHDMIHKARPNLKENTIKQYETNLRKLKKIFETDNFDFLSSPDKVKDKIKDLHYTSQRNHYNAIIVLLMALDDKKYEKILAEYGKIRDELNDKYQEEQSSGVISEKQKENFTDMKELEGMIQKMEKELKDLKLKKKKELNKKEHALLQNYVLFSIYTRLPMRNDVAGMEAITKRAYNKLTEKEKKENNYLVIEKNNMFFVLNKYKTARKYEELKIDIPADLKKLLRYYLKVNGMGVLFKSSTGKPLTRNALTQLMIKTSSKYLGKKISTTMIRKIYLSSKYGDMKEELKQDNKVMGHSMGVALNNYVKKDE